MATGSVQVYYGAGRGKSPAAFGRALRAASEGKTVFIIQFFKGKTDDVVEYLKRLEPEIKIFRRRRRWKKKRKRRRGRGIGEGRGG